MKDHTSVAIWVERLRIYCLASNTRQFNLFLTFTITTLKTQPNEKIHTPAHHHFITPHSQIPSPIRNHPRHQLCKLAKRQWLRKLHEWKYDGYYLWGGCECYEC